VKLSVWEAFRLSSLCSKNKSLPAVVVAIWKDNQWPTVKMSTEKRPLFRFGVIADIQHADIDDATNFGGTETRAYRGVLSEAVKAVDCWNRVEDPPIKFVAQLGDLVDGQNAGEYGQGLNFEEPQSDKALGRVLEVLEKADDSTMYFHAIGNHELYNFNWERLTTLLNKPGRHKVSEEGKFYFSFKPHPMWKIIMLNPYEVSVMQHEDSEGYKEAANLLNQHNPNDVLGKQGSVNYFEGLEGDKLRYVPFNGGIGSEQMKWFKTEVLASKEKNEKVIILSHLPLHHGSCSHRNVAFNSPDILSFIQTEGKGVVSLVLAGHAHRGGYHECEHSGIHHLTVQSPLSNGESHGVVSVFHDRVELKGHGALPSRILSFY